ncbi:redox-regulated ATPase YchF [Candidatus Nomurabacteria bacterium]|nr:redox-regulated ATPase YchF [Candidatus Nomurabacteria bacterium]
MKLQIGIVGLPNVGKSTLFNALTKKSVPAENYPFCTIDPSVGIVSVPDERLYKLSEFSKSEKTLPAVVEFVDIAGLVEGASKGEGLGNQFLSHIREVDAILEMVRLFEIVGGDDDITHVYGNVDPMRDIKVINMELMLSDLETVTKRLGNIARDVKKNEKEAIIEESALKKVILALEKEDMINTIDFTEAEEKKVKALNLLTSKKIIYGLNKRSGSKNFDEENPAMFKELTDFIEQNGAGWVVIDAKIENELKDFEGNEREEMREAIGAPKDDGINTLIKSCYNLLDLCTYFTTGPDETRGWTIKKGSSAPVAGMAIHTDFKDKFIRAEVINWQDLLTAGSYANARAQGKLRTEGKEYIVKDGDVVEFKI